MSETKEPEKIHEILTYEEAAALLRIHVGSLRRLVSRANRGLSETKFPHLKIGGAVRFQRSELLSFLRRA